jgi:hypothetical protein
MYDVLAVVGPIAVDLHVHWISRPSILDHLRVLIDDIVELNGNPRLDLAHSIDRTHNHLVKKSADQELRLSRELQLHDSPNLFSDFFTQIETLTELLHPSSSKVK